ncbi:FecR domain-containing protein [Lichenifustis flavocetrariae]|uniref:FecR family protein n=1 Tax=Lichenifustis flavocetrariae TaxID=2949735 RepID=A0AA42CNG7_9HYPH|nr:FecR domain-containing protein [Lichenifustis flavocetrariae]MCW6509365.1 FecR family protein [Lichenifustis flavocetrariae]
MMERSKTLVAVSAVRPRRGFVAFAFALQVGIVALVQPGSVRAQDGGCRLLDSESGPERQILRCASGPTIEAEKAADVHVIDPGSQGKPTGAKIGAGAVLVDVPPGYPGGFQILAPRAIASVRGTAWAVDVSPAQTSVFVLRGEVLVRQTGTSRAVALHKGEGVDVLGDGRPLHVSRWPASRAAALLARFGR